MHITKHKMFIHGPLFSPLLLKGDGFGYAHTIEPLIRLTKECYKHFKSTKTQREFYTVCVGNQLVACTPAEFKEFGFLEVGVSV